MSLHTFLFGKELVFIAPPSYWLHRKKSRELASGHLWVKSSALFASILSTSVPVEISDHLLVSFLGKSMTNLTYQQLEDLKQAFNEATPGVWFRLHDTPPEYQADDVEDKVQPDGSQLFLAQPTKKSLKTTLAAALKVLDSEFPRSYAEGDSTHEALQRLVLAVTSRKKAEQ